MEWLMYLTYCGVAAALALAIKAGVIAVIIRYKQIMLQTQLRSKG